MQKFGEPAKRGNFSEWWITLKKEKIREAYFIRSKSIAKNFIEFNGTSILSSESLPRNISSRSWTKLFFFLFYFSSSLHFRIVSLRVFSTNLFFFSKTFEFPLREDFSPSPVFAYTFLIMFVISLFFMNSLWRYPKFSLIAYNF